MRRKKRTKHSKITMLYSRFSKKSGLVRRGYIKRAASLLLAFTLCAASLQFFPALAEEYTESPGITPMAYTPTLTHSYDQLGDWNHYIGILFDTLVTNGADTEGAFAIGKRINMRGYSFSIGDALGEAAAKQGYYTNPNGYPTLMFGGDGKTRTSDTTYGALNSLYAGTNVTANPPATTTNWHDVLGAGFTTSKQMHDRNGALVTGTRNGMFEVRGKYYVAAQEDLDTWFDYWYRYITHAVDQYIDAGKESGNPTLTLGEFVYNPGRPNVNTVGSGDKRFWYDKYNLSQFENSVLSNGGQIDNRTLIINIDCTGYTSWTFNDVWNTDGNNKNTQAMQLPVSQLMVDANGNKVTVPTGGDYSQYLSKLKYDLIIYNFIGLETANFASSPQTLSGNSGIANKTWKSLTPTQKLERALTCSNTIFSFPDATSINSETGYVVGAVIAPNAEFNAKGGSLNGQLVAQTYIQSGSHEVHALPLTRKAYDITDDPDADGKIILFKYVRYNKENTTQRVADSKFVLWRINEGKKEYYANGGVWVGTEAEAAKYSPTVNSRVEIEGLEKGTYTLEEIEPPPGFALNTTNPGDIFSYFQHEVTIDDDAKEVTVDRYNEPLTWDFPFRKIVNELDGTTSPLEGAGFTLYRLADQFLNEDRVYNTAQIISDENGYFTIPELPVGKYILRETAIPDGYAATGELYFRVRNNVVFSTNPGKTYTVLHLGHKDNGYVNSSGGPNTDPNSEDRILVMFETGTTPDPTTPIYEVVNTYRETKTTLVIYKHEDEDAGHPVPNAEFTLWRKNGNHWVQVTDNSTDLNPGYGVASDHPSLYKGLDPIKIESSTGYFDVQGLLPGEYRLVETLVPVGYEALWENNTADSTFVKSDGTLINDGFYSKQATLEEPEDGPLSPFGKAGAMPENLAGEEETQTADEEPVEEEQAEEELTEEEPPEEEPAGERPVQADDTQPMGLSAGHTALTMASPARVKPLAAEDPPEQVEPPDLTEPPEPETDDDNDDTEEPDATEDEQASSSEDISSSDASQPPGAEPSSFPSVPGESTFLADDVTTSPSANGIAPAGGDGLLGDDFEPPAEPFADPPADLTDMASVLFMLVGNTPIEKPTTDLVIEKWGDRPVDNPDGSSTMGIGLIDTASFRLDMYSEAAQDYTIQMNELANSYTVDGLLKIEGLLAGKYRIIERTTPNGYIGLEGDFLSAITDYIYFTVVENPDGTLGVENVYIEYYDSATGDYIAIEDTGSGPNEGTPLVYEMDENENAIHLRLYNKARTARLEITKINGDVYFEGRIEEDGPTDDYRIIQEPVEGAKFRLQRQYQISTNVWSDWADYTDIEFESEIYKVGGVEVLDSYGNKQAIAVFPEELIYGRYRIIETYVPDGYMVNPSHDGSESGVLVTLDDGMTTGYIVGQFSISENESGTRTEYVTAKNYEISARGNITVTKVSVDENGDRIELAGVPFRLWEIGGEGTENWDYDITLNDAIEVWDKLEFKKHYSDDDYKTGSDGTVTLDNLSPGLYALAEVWDTRYVNGAPDGGFLAKDYLFYLSHQIQLLEEADINQDYYFHLTLFRVVAIDKDDYTQGVRIAWVHQQKIWSNEAEFDNATSTKENWSLAVDGTDDQHLAFTIVNRAKTELPVDVQLKKTDAETGNALEGATFELYRRVDFSNEVPIPKLVAQGGDYELVDQKTSQPDGSVTFTGLDATWRWNRDTTVEHDDSTTTDYAKGATAPYRSHEDIGMWSEYMILETGAPAGYDISKTQPIYFMLFANPLSKALDLVDLYYGSNVVQYPDILQGPPAAAEKLAPLAAVFGTVPISLNPNKMADVGSWWHQNYSEPEEDEPGYPFINGHFTTTFSVWPDVKNVRDPVEFYFYKRDADDMVYATIKGLEGAVFGLYYCDSSEPGHNHTGQVAEENSCWSYLLEEPSDSSGKVTFTGITPGEYRLVEHVAPEGYEKALGCWRVVVNNSGRITALTYLPTLRGETDPGTKSDGPVIWLIGNRERYKLPDLGGIGIWWFITGGTLLMATSMLVLYRDIQNRRRARLLRVIERQRAARQRLSPNQEKYVYRKGRPDIS